MSLKRDIDEVTKNADYYLFNLLIFSGLILFPIALIILTVLYWS